MCIFIETVCDLQTDRSAVDGYKLQRAGSSYLTQVERAPSL
jgi:hypothetical protein